MDEILSLLPAHFHSPFTASSDFHRAEEIRLRIHQPIEIVTPGESVLLKSENGQSCVMTEEDMEYTLNQLSEFSLYAFHEEMKQGYITTKGGHRVGIGGQVVHEEGRVSAIKHVRYFNIRKAADHKGAARPFIKRLLDDSCGHTLIIGTPRAGKTTFLRDIARLASEGVPEMNIAPKKVGIVDERSELAACYEGIPSFDVGPRTDVLDACPKAEGMMMMIRSMSPEILIVDEIGRKEDATAIMEAVHAGVTVFCSAHGGSLSEVKKRPMIRNMINASVFKKTMFLQRTKGQIHVNMETLI